MEINQILAQNIRVLMAKKDKKISDVWREADIARSTLTDLSKGKTKQISFSTLEKLSNYFEIETYKLFKKDGI
ncbi:MULTISPECIES: helix-turn-helix transcriptional regulator [Staphylococcus]|uniref:helix-turn-helix domain-containing protein n=1 Tax=Staphylococcus TaxID=1279 RepID=UPI0008A5027E|nr:MULTISPECIES: helix-turn-helix transcriptional regulator [Staphylococcus]MCH8641133.1 helix-turn-helix transcriptional regulator [Staphylococcus lugdunensis]MCH8644461.1 helix-turn-helix transcriptional regulator [Staphylococcus lugdunensis]MDK7860038.1 helix-turn-helix transcriptional regulator [Staphylococcus lugdunensis]MDK8290183.1 helix-turn-helix transcriptional regulator [Staphylococcus lugdunensis]MDU7271065.1 helix-turn-helix transcriptional regulator [Staphylococcus lugdunensis]